MQRERNLALKQACAKLKADSRNTGKEVSIEWLVEGSKDRTISVNKQIVFVQKFQDAIGIFQSPFQNMTV